MIRYVQKPLASVRIALVAAVGLPVFLLSNAFAQDQATTGSNIPSNPPAGGQAEVERVVVTGSNIPSAEETGPNQVDTYRAEDIQKLGELSRFRYTKAYPPGTLEIDLPAERLVSGFCASISSR